MSEHDIPTTREEIAAHLMTGPSSTYREFLDRRRAFSEEHRHEDTPCS